VNSSIFEINEGDYLSPPDTIKQEIHLPEWNTRSMKLQSLIIRYIKVDFEITLAKPIKH
jgi:hypothetical protein